MTRRSLLASISVCALFCEKVSSFSLTPPMTTYRDASSLPVLKALHVDDSAEHATPLKLSAADLERFASLKTRQTTMPILILDALLPKQELTFESSDPKFVRLIQYCLEQDKEIGVLGVNPMTGSPLSRGVTVDVDETNIKILPNKKSATLSVTASRRLEVLSEPWLDKTGSFYLADVEMIDNQKEPPLSPEQEAVVAQLSESLPGAIEEWTKWVVESGKTDAEGLKSRLAPLGDMPSDLTNRAFWVAAALNPTPALGVCLEIRPAMLSCTNNYERMVLACQAIRSSIDHLSGKRRLF